MAEQSAKRKDFAPAPPRLVDFDVTLALVVAALLAFGLMMVFSTTFDWSYLEFDSPLTIFLRQVRSAVIGFVALVIAWRIDYRLLKDRRIVTGIMVVTVMALGSLFLLNNTVFGAQRSFFNGSYQPGEAAKLAVIIYFAAWLSSRRKDLHKLGYGLIPFTILVGLVGGLIVLQPDLSTAAIITITAGTMFFVAGANLLQVGIVATGSVAIGWILATQLDFARERLIDHVAAMQDLTDASWHVQQAVIAFTAPDGVFTPNWFGVGLGQSSQKFGFLPTPHTDSIFAIIGEELGLFGCLVVIALYVVFVWRTFKIAENAPDFFGSILAVGIASWIAYEALLNIAVITALVPFTGVTLPFISYGGSSLVVVMTAVGLLLNVSRQRSPVVDSTVSSSTADMDFSRVRRIKRR